MPWSSKAGVGAGVDRSRELEVRLGECRILLEEPSRWRTALSLYSRDSAATQS